MRDLIGWNSVLYQSTDARSNLWCHSACAGKLKTFFACACKLWIKLVFVQFKANFFTNVSKAIYKTNKKPKTVLCSVIKHARKWREHSRSKEKHSPAARVHPTLLSCSRHFLACFITEQSTVLAFLFVKQSNLRNTSGMVNWEMELGESHNETVWNQWTKSLSVEMPLQNSKLCKWWIAVTRIGLTNYWTWEFGIVDQTQLLSWPCKSSENVWWSLINNIPQLIY